MAEPETPQAQTWPIPEMAKIGARAIDDLLTEHRLRHRERLDVLGVEVCKSLGLDPVARDFRVDFVTGLVTDLGPKE